MRKSLAIIIMSIYGVLSIGIHLHLHYCCGKLSDISIFSSKQCNHQEDHDDTCCKKSSNCCQFQDVSLKLDESHNSSSFSFNILQPISDQVFNYAFVKQLIFEDLNRELPKAHAPPAAVPIFIQHHSLVLYA
jgi:hypothetical protein